MKNLALLLSFLCVPLFAAPGPVLISVTAPLTISNGLISIPSATSIRDGYLSQTDWSTFNNKLSGTLLTTKGDIIGYSNTPVRLPVGTNGQVLVADSTQTLGIKWGDAAAGGITSLNGLTGATQTFATPGTSGLSPNWVSSGTAHTLNIPLASASSVSAGLLSKSDYDVFAAKQAAGNYITALTGDVTASGPGSAAASISASTVTGKLITGFLSGAGSVTASDTILTAIDKLDGNIAGKQASGNYITALTGDVTASGPGSSAASISDTTVTGKLLTNFVSGSGSVTASDSILTAFNKVVGNDALKAPLANPVFTGVVQVADGSAANPSIVSSAGTTTGISFIGASNVIRFSNAGAEFGRFSATGQLLLGRTTFPQFGGTGGNIGAGFIHPADSSGGASIVGKYEVSTDTVNTGSTNAAIYGQMQRTISTTAPTEGNITYASLYTDTIFNVPSGQTYTHTGTLSSESIPTGLLARVPRLTGAGAVALTNAAGIQVLSSTYNSGTNKYGIVVGDMSGASTNYALYTGAGLIHLGGQTATTVPYIDASKNLTSSAVTPTQLGYLSGASGTTGTASLVYNTSPNFATAVTFGNYHLDPTINAIGNSGSSKTIDWSLGSIQTITLTANCTFTFSNLVSGGTYILQMTTDSGGPYTQTWPGTVNWSNSATPQTGAAGAVEYVSFVYNGSNSLGSFWTGTVPSVFAGGIGSAGSPTFTFSANLTSGMYQSATNNVDWATNGTARLNLGATGALTLMTSSGANLLWNTNGGGNIGAGTSSTITNAPDTIYFKSRLQGNSQSGSNADFYVDVSSATGDMELFNGARNKIMGMLVDTSFGYIVFGGAGKLLFDGTNIYVAGSNLIANSDATPTLGSGTNRFKSLYLSGLISRGYTRASVSTGGSTTVAVATGYQVFHSSGTMATYTVTTPASPVDQQTLQISFDQVVTALTLTPNTSQTIACSGTVTSYTPGTTHLDFIWVSTDSTWYCL